MKLTVGWLSCMCKQYHKAHVFSITTVLSAIRQYCLIKTLCHSGTRKHCCSIQWFTLFTWSSHNTRKHVLTSSLFLTETVWLSLRSYTDTPTLRSLAKTIIVISSEAVFYDSTEIKSVSWDLCRYIKRWM